MAQTIFSDEQIEECREMATGAPVNVTMRVFIDTTDRLRRERDYLRGALIDRGSCTMCWHEPHANSKCACGCPDRRTEERD
jgi:hypothetical protein